MASKRILVCVGGGIAAYKSVLLVRELLTQGYAVRVAMTPSAAKFVGPVTFSGLTGQPAVMDLWDPGYAGELHVELARWADAIVVAPATANLISRMATGAADDVVLATLLCSDKPVLVAPAMHHAMYNHPATQANVQLLRKRGIRCVGPEEGPLASGEVGIGRMSEPSTIAAAVAAVFETPALAGLRVLVTAGPTYEDIDPVRFVGNRSSGKMGYAVAQTAAARGAAVTLISGPVALHAPTSVNMVSVRTAQQMHAAVMEQAFEHDLVIMAAAVSDYRPEARSLQKLKRDTATRTLGLVPNPDILAELGNKRSAARPVLVGFCLETEDLVANARKKLAAKQVDMMVANDARSALEGDATELTFVFAHTEHTLGPMPKRLAAGKLLDACATLLTESARGNANANQA